MRNYHDRQHGGTLVGIIIGLVIGLGIALGVAVAITKTPMPFTNKFARTSSAADPAEGKIADPNRSLYGNKAAQKDVVRPVAKEAEDRDPPPNQVMEKKPEAKAAIVELPPIDPPKKAEPKPIESKQAMAKPEAKADNPEEKWNYFLQAGAFREQTDAENTRAKLALLGVEARVTERQSENGTLYRVRVGPFSQLEAMNRVRGKLSDNGVDAAVVRVTK